MTTLIKQSKRKIILSSIIILLPCVFGVLMWDTLPDTMVTHWDIHGTPNGSSGKFFTVFVMPVLLLIGHLLCLFVTSMDKRQKDQNPKALSMIFWLIPMLSLLVNGMLYSIALGKNLDISSMVPAVMGVMFILIGNYFPKTRQNRTLGIKLSWTLNNEENWNKTHRFAGKVWVVCGFVMLLTAFLPGKLMAPVLTVAILAMLLLPTAYSYRIYKQHQKEGILYTRAPKTKGEKAAAKFTAIVLPVTTVLVCILLFTGNINIAYNDSSFLIEANYWSDLKVDYDSIDQLEYRETFDAGTRTAGFGSFRLGMGTFSNEEFGSYTLYSYTKAKGYVILENDENILVIGLREETEIKNLYETILKNCKTLQ